MGILRPRLGWNRRCPPIQRQKRATEAEIDNAMKRAIDVELNRAIERALSDASEYDLKHRGDQ